MRGIIEMEAKVKANGLPGNAHSMRMLKSMGFSDARLAVLSGKTEAEVKAARRALNVRPVFKRIDTCAAEFASPTAYMYSTYEAPFAGAVADESAPSDKNKVIILGGGPNRIGQGIEFDYCCCHACFALHDAGYETIMVNCNPETVSTDYDTADRLYFEPLTGEDVLEIIDTERSNGTLHGVIVQFGGQTPLKLARALEEAHVPILGTSPDAIDLAEDRDRFKRVLDKLRLKQPKNGIAYSVEQARLVAADLGLPLVVRPSYVLGGRAMQIIREDRSSATICSAHCRSWCLPTSRRAIRTTRPVRSTRCSARTRCCSTAICPTPPKSTSTACATAPIRSSSASWSISRKPAFIRATAPARCRPTRSMPRRLRNSSVRPANSRSASTSSA
jgi:carbamoyl-phosphate synthase large subunit